MLIGVVPDDVDGDRWVTVAPLNSEAPAVRAGATKDACASVLSREMRGEGVAETEAACASVLMGVTDIDKQPQRPLNSAIHSSSGMQ